MPTIDTGRVSLNYVAGGTGPDGVLFVHELGGTSRSWSRLAPLLSRRWTTFAPDLRGYGLSEKPPGRREIQDYALDLADFVGALGMERVHVVGAAMGVIVAAAMASIRPDQVASLVCLGGTDALTDDARQYIQRRAETVRTDGMRAVADHSLDNSFPEAFSAMREDYRPQFLANDPVSYAEASEALCRMDVDFGRVVGRTLVASGALDFIWPPAAGRRLADRIAGSEFAVFETAGHFPHIQTPDECGARIEDFLSRSL